MTIFTHNISKGNFWAGSKKKKKINSPPPPPPPPSPIKCVMRCVSLCVARTIKPKTSFRSQEDIITKNLLKYPVLPRCLHVSNDCPRFCEASYVDEELRDSINHVYWCEPFDGRRQWLDTYININESKKKSSTERVFNREISLEYFLPVVNGGKHRVCKPLFLATLRLKNDSTIQ